MYTNHAHGAMRKSSHAIEREKSTGVKSQKCCAPVSLPWEQTIEHYRIQLRAGLQRLKESICLNSTRHAVPQARQVLRQCLTTAQLLAYPLDLASTSQLSGQESKPKLKEAEQQPVTPKSKISAQQPQNSALRPETEQLSKTADKAAAPNTTRDQVKSPHADTFAMALNSQNIAPLPEIEQAGKTAVSDTAHNQAKSPRSGTSATTSKSQNSALTPKI